MFTQSTCLFMMSRNCDSAISDIPGFHYDPVKKRYFRILPGSVNHNSVTVNIQRQREKRKWKEACTRTVKSTCSVPNVLISQQIGVKRTTEFSLEILRLKMQQLKCIYNESVYYNTMHPCTECQYINGYKDFILGAWTNTEISGSVINAVSLNFEQHNPLDDPQSRNIGPIKTDIVNVHNRHKVADLCGADICDLKFALYVCNFVAPSTRSFALGRLLPVRGFCENVNIENRQMMDRFSMNCEYENETLWSCAWNSNTNHFAFGGEEIVYINNLNSAYMRRLPMKTENIFSLEFNNTGSLVYLGTHKGNLMCKDLRLANDATAFCLSLGRGLSNIKLLADENTMFVSAYDDKLFSMDLRTRQSLFQYPEHVNTHMKLPLSYDESLNVLCSTGQDHVTRLWSLKEGKLLYCLPPPAQDSDQEHSSHPFSWFQGEDRAMYLHIFQGDKIYSFVPQATT